MRLRARKLPRCMLSMLRYSVAMNPPSATMRRAWSRWSAGYMGEHGAGGYACRYGGFVGGDVYAVSQSADYHYAVERVGKLFDEAPGKLGAV